MGQGAASYWGSRWFNVKGGHHERGVKEEGAFVGVGARSRDVIRRVGSRWRNFRTPPPFSLARARS